MTNHLSAAELSDLVGCKANQRAAMAKWLDDNHWRFVTDKNGLPKVAREYYNRKMGITNEIKGTKYADAPNLQAFC